MTNVDVTDNAAAGRFELRVDGDLIGFAMYSGCDGTVSIPHVETLAEHRGRGNASRLLDGVVDILRATGRSVNPVCPFAVAYFDDHPEHRDLVRIRT